MPTNARKKKHDRIKDLDTGKVSDQKAQQVKGGKPGSEDIVITKPVDKPAPVLIEP